jgi:hypothetical protein
MRRLTQLAGLLSLAALAYRLTRPAPAPRAAVPQPPAPEPQAPLPPAAYVAPPPAAPRAAVAAAHHPEPRTARRDDRGGFWRRRTGIIAFAIVAITALIAGGAAMIADDGSTPAPAPAVAEAEPDVPATTPGPEPMPLADVGVYIGPGDRAGFERFATWLGRRPMIASEGLEELRWDAIVDPWWLIDAWEGRDVGLAYSLVMLPREEPATLQQGAAGEYDAHYRELAERLVAGGQADAILRPGWEFNGDWQPWSARQDPEAFIAYYRRIVETMRAVPGAEFTFVWNPTIGPVDPNPWPAQRAWPGDDVVDAIGLDVYDVCYVPDTYPIPEGAGADEIRARQQRCWDELLTGDHGLRWYAAFAERKDKPLVVPEYGLVPRAYPGGGDNPVFIQGMHDWAAANDVEWMIYFNKPDSEMGNHRIDNGTYPWSQRLFRELYGAPPAEDEAPAQTTTTAG